MMPPKKPDTALQIASVTAKQAVIVALITSLAGLIGVYIGNQHKNSDTVERHIKLSAVDCDQPGAVRVVFEVNGQPYSYPSRLIWADVSEHMSEESFPLPLNASSYSVHVFAYFKDENQQIRRFETQETKEVSVSALPDQSEIKLYEVTPTYTHLGTPHLAVGFEVY
jgi:hypothetical protein